MKQILNLKVVILFMLMASQNLFANDAEAFNAIQEGVRLDLAQKPYAAADQFMDAELLADSSLIKVLALKSAASAYKQAQWHYKEFQAIESLLVAFPNHVDFKNLVGREYEIANLYYKGYREPVAKWLDWTPWTGDDRTLEIYEKAIKNGPFSPESPHAQLRLGRLYIIKGGHENVDKALVLFRNLIEHHPNTKERRVAQLEIANILHQKSIKGDGDEALANEARDLLNSFISQFAGDPEIDWAKNMLQNFDENAAKKGYQTACFYEKKGNETGAIRSARDLLERYPHTHTAPLAYTLLNRLQPNQVFPLPDTPLKRATITVPQSPIIEENVNLISPAKTDGKYLLPIEDYTWELGKNDKTRKQLRKDAEALECPKQGDFQ